MRISLVSSLKHACNRMCQGPVYNSKTALWPWHWGVGRAVPSRGWALFSHSQIERFQSLLSIPSRQHLYVGCPQNTTCQLVYGDTVYITKQNSWSAFSQTSRSQPCD